MTLKMINRVWRGKWKKRNGISWLRDQESKLYSRCMSPFMASGGLLHVTNLVAIGSRADMRRCHDRVASGAHDPTATSACISCCSSEGGLSPYQSARLNRYDASSSA
jgi:hypothetical protein